MAEPTTTAPASETREKVRRKLAQAIKDLDVDELTALIGPKDPGEVGFLDTNNNHNNNTRPT
jgi:hypothetical protein